ncbi:MAG: PfkB family carbohydrate kinase, partial [Spirochaetota bacterium]
VDTAHIALMENISTSVAVLLADSKGDQILFFGEPSVIIDWRIPKVDNYKLIVITAGVPIKKACEMANAAREAHVPFIIDPGKFIMDVAPEAIIGSIAGADSLIMNEYEYELLLRRTRRNYSDLFSLVSVGVITRGAKEICVIDRTKKEEIPVVLLKDVKDPNGAGDAFLAGYAYGRYHNYSSSWAVRMGAVSASFALEADGCQGHRFDLEHFNKRLFEQFGVLAC